MEKKELQIKNNNTTYESQTRNEYQIQYTSDTAIRHSLKIIGYDTYIKYTNKYNIST